HLGLPRGVPADPEVARGGRPGPRRHPVGDDPHRGPPVRPPGRHRGHDARPRAGAGGDDGGDDHPVDGRVHLEPHRQRQQHDPRRDRPQLPRGLRAPPRRADRGGPGAVRHHPGRQPRRPRHRAAAGRVLRSERMTTPTRTPTARLAPPHPATPAQTRQAPEPAPRRGPVPEPVHPVPRAVSYAVPLLALLVALVLWRVVGWHGALALVAGYLALLAATYTAYRAASGRRVAVDRTVRALVWGAFVLALLPLASLLWTVVSEGAGLAFDRLYLTQTMNGVTGLHDQAHVEDGAPMVGGVYHAV